MVKNTADPLGTLSIGNVVTMSTTLYKSNFKRYLLVSTRATAWIFAIFLSAIGLGILSALLITIPNAALLLIPLGLGWLFLAFYFIAKSLTDRATIGRLAYQELIDAPETISAATKHLAPRTWQFFFVALLVGLYMFLIYLGTAIVWGIVVGILSFIMGALNNVFTGVIGSILIVASFVAWIILLIRFYASWFISELPLAIEPNMTAGDSISRSSRLSAVAIGRLVLIVTVAFLITLPLQIPGQGLSFFGQIIAEPRLGGSVNNTTTGGIYVLVGTLLTLIVEIFAMPFWQAIKAVIYFDLRNRREGRDLNI
jgi:hypothetical protein